MHLFVWLCAFAGCAARSPPSFPRYLQCDPAWGDEMMGVNGPGKNDTICHQGCAMTSLAMALAGHGVRIPGIHKTPTPKTLNAWLQANHGYTCVANNCVNLQLDAPDHLTAGKVRLVGEWGGRCCGGDTAKPSLASIKEGLVEQGDHFMVYIAHVHNSHHFVLLTGWNETELMFNALDPFYNTTAYGYENISDIIMYSVLPMESVVPKRYALYQQFDYHWANDTMDTKSVASVGCLMSSTSMALNGHGVSIPDDASATQTSNPGSFNLWLRSHSGYDGSDDLIEDAVPAVDPAHVNWTNNSMHRHNDLSMDAVTSMLDAGSPVIANVMRGHHFVLVVGYDRANRTTLYVNDPGFFRITYDYADVVGWRLFNMTDVGTQIPFMLMV